MRYLKLTMIYKIAWIDESGLKRKMKTMFA